MIERIVQFKNEGMTLEGVLRYPDRLASPAPCLVIIHGSLEHDRDGNLLHTEDGRPIYKKDTFLKIADRLCQNGFVTFSWDKSGYGKSVGRKGDYFDQANEAKAAIDALVNDYSDIVDPEKLSVLGQSAGVYIQCLLARLDDRPSSYILSGGLFSDYYDMMSFNYHRVRDYAARSQENLEWAKTHDLWGLKLGINLDRMFEAVRSGKTEWTMVYDGVAQTIPINQKVYDDAVAPKKLFKHIKKTALVIHGREDLNVPVQDAFDIDRVLAANGNSDVELVIIPKVDHSFQFVPEDKDARLRERMSLESFKNPVSEEYFDHLVTFLKRVYMK